jgi:inhibitor of the pro-sigma K processing machinery
MDIIIIFLIGIILIILGVLGISVLIKVGKIVLSILLHMIIGVILLFIFNLLPFFKIPINILTILVAGFGGVIGFGLLIVAKAFGFY